MCDFIDIKGDKQYDSIREDNYCLCNSTDEEIGAFIFKKLELQIDEVVIIERSPFGYYVKKINIEEYEEMKKKKDEK